MPIPPLTFQVWPGSGLTFGWRFVAGSTWPGDLSLGFEGGSVLTEQMEIQFADLVNPAVNVPGQLLGWSERVPSTQLGTIGLGQPPPQSQLNRHLPFQHPLYPELWCTRITRVEERQSQGYDLNVIIPRSFENSAPYGKYTLARLTLMFTRPPYAIVSDSDMDLSHTDALTGSRQEWLRYTDRFWSVNTQILGREQQQYQFAEGRPSQLGTPPGSKPAPFPSAFGKPVSHQKLKRTWYQVPEAGVYDANGYPANLFDGFLTRYIVGAANNGSGFVRLSLSGTNGGPAGPGGIPYGLTKYSRLTITGTGSYGSMVGYDGYWSVGAVNPGAGTVDLLDAKYNPAVSTGTVRTDPLVGTVNNTQFLGVNAGALLFETAEVTPRPLQMPASLMGIFNETVQLQYDVTLHFDRFDPALGGGDPPPTTRGHNTAPWPGDGGNFYLVTSQTPPDGQRSYTYTPFGWTYLPFLWQCLILFISLFLDLLSGSVV